MGLDLTPVRSAADTIKTTLNGLNTLADQVKATATDAAKAQSAEMRELRARAQAAVLAAKEAIAVENAKVAALKTETAELGRQQAEQKGVTAAAQAGIAAAKEKAALSAAETAQLKTQTAQLALQTAELRKQALEQRLSAAGGGHGEHGSAHGEHGGHGGVFTGLGENVSKGLLGEGLAGSMAGGLLAGAGIAGAIALAGSAVEELLAKLREVTVESGKLTILQDVFEGLAHGAGVDASEMMTKLSEATEGLVSKTTLLKVANTELRSPLHLTQDQIMQLVGGVTKLSEAAGNTAEQGMSRLNMAFLRGRPMILATTLGVQGLREMMRDIPPGMSAAARTSLIWERSLKLINDQAEKLGELPVTLEQMTTRMHIATTNVTQAFGQGFGESPGMQTFIKTVDSLIGKFGGLETVSKRVGAALGNMFGTLSGLAPIALATLSSMQTAFTALAQIISDVLNFVLNSTATDTDHLAQEFKNAHPILNAFGASVIFVASSFRTLLNSMQAVYELMHALSHPFTGPSSTVFADWVTRQKQIADDATKAMASFQHTGGQIQQDASQPKEKRPAIARNDTQDAGANRQQRDKRAQALLQERIAQAKLELEQKKNAIADEKAEDDEKYKYEQESLEQHYANMAKIAAESRDAAKAEAQQSFEAKKTELAATSTDAVVHAAKLKTIQAELHMALDRADAAYTQSARARADAQAKDQQEAATKAVEGRLRAQESALSRQQKSLQGGLQQGTVDPDSYFQKQISFIQQEADAKIKAANDVYAIGVQNATKLQAKTDSVNSAIESAETALQALTANESQVRLQYVEKRFQPQQQAIQSQLGGLGQGENPTHLQEQMKDLLGQELVELEAQIKHLPEFSDGWNVVYSKIEQTYQMQQKYNEELRKSHDLMQPIASSLQGMVGLMDSIWSSKFVKSLSAGMSSGISAIRNANQTGTTIANAIHPGSSEAKKDPQLQALEDAAKSAANTFGGVRSSASTLETGMSSLTSTVSMLTAAMSRLTTTAASDHLKASGALDSSLLYEPTPEMTQTASDTKKSASSSAKAASSADDIPTRFAAGLTAATSELADFASAVTHSTSKLGGAISGGTAGYGAGQAANSAMSNMGGAMGSLSSYMPGIGAGIGVMMGMISGAKNAEMSSEMSALNSEYTSIMDAYHSNNDNLQETIAQMQELIAEAQVDEANSKKGGSTFASLISQYSEELNSLKNQQSSIISDMQTQLAIFSTPTGMQQYLSSLNSIIEEYDKFEGAAANASQLAEANSWLTDSLSSYTEQMENTYVNDEESGISDALNLNSLLSERSTLISDLNNSIQNVMEQGVLTRQQTSAQTKGQKIEKLESAASSQLSSINQEISLEQYKVGIETSLYNLAMTSMGLEAQLLALQEGQASQSLAAISALQTLINTLQSGSYNFGSISAILSSLGYSSVSITSGTVSTVSSSSGSSAASTSAMDSLVAAAYQSRATLGYASYRGGNL